MLANNQNTLRVGHRARRLRANKQEGYNRTLEIVKTSYPQVQCCNAEPLADVEDPQH